MSRLPIRRVLPTATSGLASPSAATAGFESAAFDTNVTDDDGNAFPNAPNIGR